MLRGRTRIPLLAEIAGPAEETRSWALRRADLEALEEVLPRLAEHRVVAVVGEGDEATIAAIALASAAAASGRRTILVDCGLAGPRVAQQLGLAAAPGLHEYLRWEAEPADVLQPVMLAGSAAGGLAEPLVCVAAGRPAGDAETPLGLPSFSHMVAKLRGAYELVLLLAPPVIDEPRACLAVAAKADAVIAGLRTAAVKGGDGRAARAAVRRLPPPVLGTVAVKGVVWAQRS
jgi:succinoglycan biosynthesis transport protein ExoP